MKTKAAFQSLLVLAVATTFLAGETASAQMRTSLSSKKKTTATSQLKTKVKAKEETQSPFSLSISETYFGKQNNESNYVESYFTAGYEFMKNVSFGLEIGIESYIERQEKNNTFDLEGSITVSKIEIAKDFTFSTGLMAIAPTSRSSRDSNMAGAWGIKGSLGLKLGATSLGLSNSFYQFAYNSAPVATPAEEDISENRFYKNLYTLATSVFSVSLPVGPIKWKNDIRYRQSTPYAGEEKRPVRYRSSASYGFTDELSGTAGVSWQKNVIDKTAPSFFDGKHRTIYFNLSLDV